MDGKFLYFGFGSNLLKERLLINNPSAVFKTIGRLDGYTLAFDYLGKRWHGAAATIQESAGSHVWGTVWIVDKSDMPNLDRQEGVPEGIYRPLEVEINTPDGEKLQCRAYQLLMLGSEDKRPSPQYMGVIIKGAKQHELPEEYIQKLQAIEHNGYEGECRVLDEVKKLEKTCADDS